MIVLIVLGVLILLVISCALVWKTAKIHMLHKVRKVFNKTYDIYISQYGDQEGPFISGFMSGLGVIDKIESEEKRTIL